MRLLARKKIKRFNRKITKNNYIYLGGEFHNDIKMVHFTHSINKPENWKDYKYFNKEI